MVAAEEVEEDIFLELVKMPLLCLSVEDNVKKSRRKKREAKMSEENKELFSCLRKRRWLLMQAGAKTSLVG